jgi:hypothetical protein
MWAELHRVADGFLPPAGSPIDAHNESAQRTDQPSQGIRMILRGLPSLGRRSR